MKCPRCNSENVQMQAKEYKPKIIGVACLIGAGFGLMFFGIGAVIGAIVGLIVGIILNSIMSNTYQSVMVCQNCGYVSQPMNQPIAQGNGGTLIHPLFCDPEESTLEIIRNDAVKGAVILIRVKIDNHAPFNIGDDSVTSLKLPEGVHTISYEQINGVGRKKNKGQMSVTVGDKASVNMSFAYKGVLEASEVV